MHFDVCAAMFVDAEREFRLRLSADRTALGGKNLDFFLYSYHRAVRQRPVTTIFIPRGACPLPVVVWLFLTREQGGHSITSRMIRSFSG